LTLIKGKHDPLFGGGKHIQASMLGECPHVPKILMVGQSIFLKKKLKKNLKKKH
jgi:hypothetical protein